MQDDLSLEAYDFTLPPENIAQQPAKTRDRSKLLLLDNKTKHIRHSVFKDIVSLFQPGDILVVNDTKVFPARLHGKKDTGGKAEVFLLNLPTLSQKSDLNSGVVQSEASALIKSSRKPAVGHQITISNKLKCQILQQLEGGKVKVGLEHSPEHDIAELLSECGSVPLPPYIEREEGPDNNDSNRYQTVYAAHNGAVAAPTAGLHFTEEILSSLEEKGVITTSLTLHVGYGTFAPVRSQSIVDHKIHSEFISLPQKTVEKIRTAKQKGGKVWAVGTTTVRALEFSCDTDGILHENDGWCDLYIYPGFTFNVIDNLITNFHLPRSSLLFLVAALCGRTTLLQCYHEAIAADYRFYSYGDAMAIMS